MAVPPPIPQAYFARRSARSVPPPLPGRSPPPLPSRGGPPPLPGIRTPDVYAGREQIDGDHQRISTRDVQRASGRTYGVWVSTTSQWVNRMRYDPEYDLQTGYTTGRGTITIEFLDLSMFEYPDRSAADWIDLFSSSSKGRFVYYAAKGWTYRQLKKASRSSREVARLSALRAPRGQRQGKRSYVAGGKRVGGSNKVRWNVV